MARLEPINSLQLFYHIPDWLIRRLHNFEYSFNLAFYSSPSVQYYNSLHSLCSCSLFNVHYFPLVRDVRKSRPRHVTFPLLRSHRPVDNNNIINRHLSFPFISHSCSYSWRVVDANRSAKCRHVSTAIAFLGFSPRATPFTAARSATLIEKNENANGKIMCSARSLCTYALYASLAYVFAWYIFADYCLNVILDKYVEDEPVENRYFDHIVGKYFIVHTRRTVVINLLLRRRRPVGETRYWTSVFFLVNVFLLRVSVGETYNLSCLPVEITMCDPAIVACDKINIKLLVTLVHYRYRNNGRNLLPSSPRNDK